MNRLNGFDEFFDFDQLEKLRKQGLIEFDKNSLRATFPKGIKLLDTVVLNVMVALKMSPEERNASENEMIQPTHIDNAIQESRQEEELNEGEEKEDVTEEEGLSEINK